MFDWLKPKVRRRRRKIQLDRNHLEARARRFLTAYLDAHVMRKPQFYRAVEDASKHCQQAAGELPLPSELADTAIAEATSEAAINVVLERENRASEINPTASPISSPIYMRPWALHIIALPVSTQWTGRCMT